ncbi:hypothetical protein G6714_04470 [Polynucleobacter paneuropaeus]|nr:hypothetical protein [Polynucleobacter paneuropaeus]
MIRPKNLLLLKGLLLSVILSGCASVSPDFSDMSQSYQKSIEKYQNNNFLLNIVRSSKEMPLSFIDIPSVIGTGNITETAGLAGLIYSASPGSGLSGVFSAAGSSVAASYTYPSLSLSLGRSFNFTQSSLANAQFQKEFLSVIPIETINFFARHHIPPEVIFSLTIDSIEVSKPDGTTKVYFNNPTSPNFSEFQTLIRQLIQYGFTTEVVKTANPIGPALDVKKLGPTLPQTILQYVGSKNSNKLDFKPASEKNPDLYQFTQEITTARLCFAAYKNIQAVKREFGESMLCQNPLGTTKQKVDRLGITGTLSPNKDKTSLAIAIRSNRDVYHFLGEVLIAQIQAMPRMTYLEPTAISNQQKKSFNEEKVPLLVINKNPPFGMKSIATIDYDGDNYSIPAENNGYSALVIDVLSQFLNLNKIPGSIPASPSVLVK